MFISILVLLSLIKLFLKSRF